ncbi:MAG: hypothetical protein J7M06_05895, partial [Proteobacteria bacterium]|nr:hypothetical protein [Pseudomonadota bacterium]
MTNALPKVKYSFAGLISYLSLSLGNELTESDIRGLFDAVTCEQGRGKRDSDFPESRKELTAIIERERA